MKLMRECLTCDKKSDDKKLFYELTAKTGPRFICKECAAEIGINNFWSAGFNTNTQVLKEYVKIHPDAQDRLDRQLQLLEQQKEVIKPDLKQIAKKATQHNGCKRKKQIKCSCKSCDHVYYYGDFEVVKGFTNAFHGSVYSLNQFKDLNQCPKCGSRAVSKKEVYFWVDKQGNCVDVEE